MSDMLSVKGLSISFGGLKAVNNFAINIEKGQLYGLIGPNGAGKTTIFNLLTGVYKPDTGTILLDGQNLTGKSTTDINKAGIARTFQNIRLFKDLQKILPEDSSRTLQNTKETKQVKHLFLLVLRHKTNR